MTGLTLKDLAFLPVAALDPVVVAWAARVVANGAAAPTTAVKNAFDVYVKGCKADGIWTQKKSIACFVMPNLISCATTLILGPFGSDPWGINGFVAGNLNANGLLGVPANTTNFTTNLSPANLYSSDTNAGFSIYIHTTTNTAAFEMGRLSGTGAPPGVFQCSTNYTDGKFRGDMWNNSIDELQATINLAGFYSMNRLAANDFQVYFANSTNPWASKGTDNVLNGVRFSDVGLFAMATGTFTGTVLQPSDRRVSFMEWHDGYSSADGLKNYNRVQALLTALGGGFV